MFYLQLLQCTYGILHIMLYTLYTVNVTAHIQYAVINMSNIVVT